MLFSLSLSLSLPLLLSPPSLSFFSVSLSLSLSFFSALCLPLYQCVFALICQGHFLQLSWRYKNISEGFCLVHSGIVTFPLHLSKECFSFWGFDVSGSYSSGLVKVNVGLEVFNSFYHCIFSLDSKSNFKRIVPPT